jgi:hypothetical protein
MKECKNLEIYNDYNSKGVLSYADNSTAANVMVSHDGKSALVILANFSETEKESSVGVDWKNTVLKPGKNCVCKALMPGFESPGTPETHASMSEFRAKIAGNGCVGWLLCKDKKELVKILKNYEVPYSKPDEDEKKYLSALKEQENLRKAVKSEQIIFLKVMVPTLALPYDESMWWDLFDSALQIGIFDLSGKFEPRGWISRNGFAGIKPEKNDYVWPGQCTAWIPLHKHFPPGKHKLGIRSIHLGEPFYSFVRVTLSSKPTDSAAGAYTLKFMNELEHDRSFICFKINIK